MLAGEEEVELPVSRDFENPFGSRAPHHAGPGDMGREASHSIPAARGRGPAPAFLLAMEVWAADGGPPLPHRS